MHTSDDPLLEAILAIPIPSRAKILVAVSGGPDSVALLDAVDRARSLRPGWTLRVGHVNHGLRAEESDADEALVRSMAATRGLEIGVWRVDIPELRLHRNVSPEEAARDLRYHALRQVLQEWRGDLIVTGHTMNDQAETIIMRLLRGAGLTGLGGIRPRSGEIVRPFLAVSRETILMELQRRGLGYRLDKSNLDQRLLRNRIRREIMPALSNAQVGLPEVLARTADILQRDAGYLDREIARVAKSADTNASGESPTVSRAVFAALHPALQAGVLRLQAFQVLPAGTRLSHEAVERMRDATLSANSASDFIVPVAGEVELHVSRESFSISAPFVHPWSTVRASNTTVPGRAENESGTLEISLLERGAGVDRLLTVCGPFHALMDATALGATVTLRGRAEGDRLRPLGLGGTRKLQDIFTDRRIPRGVRHLVPVVENGNHIVWIPGLALDERVAVTESTRAIAHLVFRPSAAGYRGRIPQSFPHEFGIFMPSGSLE